MLNPGDILQDRYRVVSQLGRGGMGAVYRAWDMRLNVLVALKEMVAQPDLDTEALRDLQTQFQQEATVLARLSHPHLVGVSDYFHEGRTVYLVMKYVEGQSLADLIKQVGPIPEPQVVAWSVQLLSALSYCHGQGVIHRDIKPQNIIIGPDGNAVLVDFGLVKLWNPNDPRTRTAVRGVGTPQYAPPEQYDTSAGHTEPRSDLYSVGATMYHALTGQAPLSATMRIAAPEEFAPLRLVAPGVSPQTASAIERAMELARTRRWESADAMAQALGQNLRASGGRGDYAPPPQSAAAVGHGGTAMMPPSQATGPATATAAYRPPSGALTNATRRRIPLWIPVIGMAVVLFGGFGIAAALALTGIVDFGLPSSWTPWLAASDVAAGTPTGVVPTVAQSTPVAAATSTPYPSATATDAVPSPTLTSAPSSGAGGGKATETPAPTATVEPPTATPTPYATETPSPPTATPAPPTATPAPPTATVSSPTPSATPPSEPVPTGALVSFEQWGTWRRGDQPYGDFVQTQDQVYGGAICREADV